MNHIPLPTVEKKKRKAGMLVQGTLTAIPRVSCQPSSTSLETFTVVSLEIYPKEQTLIH